MTEELKKKLQTSQRRMMRMIIQAKRQVGRSYAAAQFASETVDVTTDAELHDPISEPEDDTTEHNHQDPNEHEESSHDADSNSWFDEIPKDNPEDELDRTVGLQKESNAQIGRLVSSKQNHVVDSQAEPDFLGGRQG